MRIRSGAPLLALATACGAPTNPAASPSPPVDNEVGPEIAPVASASPSPALASPTDSSSATAIASSATPPASAAPPSPPPVADPDKLALARAICPAAIQHDGSQIRVGCRACPPFVGAAAQPDGHVVSDPDSFWPLEQRYPGAFTRAGATEVAAVFQGCESHAQNYGGTLLVTQTARGFTPGAYFVGVHPSSCQPYHRADGRDLLVCQWSDAHQSSAFTQVFVYDFVRGTQDSERGWTSLVNVHDNSALACMGMLSGSGLHQGHVVGFRFEDRNGDGQLDLVVDVEHKHTMPSPSLDASVAGACKAAAPAKADDLPHIDVATLFGAPVPRTLVFLYANGSFHADAPTAAALKDL